tara:strand:- start:1573 stop:2172 length:600 start_codon:yes stop_codon:yes gene_type:complete
MNNTVILLINTKKNIQEFLNFLDKNNIKNKFKINNSYNFNDIEGNVFEIKNGKLINSYSDISEELYNELENKKYNNYNKYFFDKSKSYIDTMLGGGYHINVSQAINGNPEIIGYDDFKPPIINTKNNMEGGGFFLDIGKDNVGGKADIGSYDDQQPPLFVQSGGNLLNKKIKHLINYISLNGDYKLPKIVLSDLDKFKN